MKRACKSGEVRRPARSRMKNRLSLAWLALACVGFLAAAAWSIAAEQPSVEGSSDVATPAASLSAEQVKEGPVKLFEPLLNQVKFPIPE